MPTIQNRVFAAIRRMRLEVGDRLNLGISTPVSLKELRDHIWSEMRRCAVLSGGVRKIPNDVTVYLNPVSLEALCDKFGILADLEDALITAVREENRFTRFSTNDPFCITVRPRQYLPQYDIDVESAFRVNPVVANSDHDLNMSQHLRVVIGAPFRELFQCNQGLVRVGRSLQNDYVIRNPGVPRKWIELDVSKQADKFCFKVRCVSGRFDAYVWEETDGWIPLDSDRTFSGEVTFKTVDVNQNNASIHFVIR